MNLYQAVTPHTDLVKPPNCSDCGAATQLYGIEAERPGCELLTFVCPECKHIETAVAKVAQTVLGLLPANSGVPDA